MGDCVYTLDGKQYTEDEFKDHLIAVPELARTAGVASLPTPPFKTTWQELALKRMVRYASEHGYDKLAWTTGEQQNERYDLSKQVDQIQWESNSKNPRDGMVVEILLKDNIQSLPLTVNQDGKVLAVDASEGRDMVGKPLSDVIGKDVADRILAKPSGVLKGEGLRIFGSGMKGFYDQILPAYLNKWAKPFGVKVGTTRIAQAGASVQILETFGDRGPLDRITLYLNVDNEMLLNTSYHGTTVGDTAEPVGGYGGISNRIGIKASDKLKAMPWDEVSRAGKGWKEKRLLLQDLKDLGEWRAWDTLTDDHYTDPETGHPRAFTSKHVGEAWLAGKGKLGGPTVHALTITDEMRQTAMEGLPLFSRAPQTNTAAFQAWFKDSKVVDAEGQPLIVYHGTKRGDRVGNRFRKTRATSGPMAFFTTDEKIATNYSTGKEDTSLEHPDDYSGWFTFKPRGARTRVSADRAWYFLSDAQRKTVLERLPTVGYKDHDQASGPIVADSQSIAGKDHVAYLLKEARGNGLKAAVELWLNSGSLFDDEEKFFDVLKGLGLDGLFEWNSPWKTSPRVYQVYLSIQKPLVTNEMPPEVVDALERRARRQPMPKGGEGADLWDKRRRDPQEWVRQLKEDVDKGGNSMVWTSVPDWVTATLKTLGYDGIHDTGGKMGGQEHDVWIPFDDRQVKSATDNRGTFDPTVPDIRFARKLTMPSLLRSAREQWALLDSTYKQIQMVPMGGRQVAIMDAGSRLSDEELARITGNKAMQQATTTILSVLDDIMAQVVGEHTVKIEHTGLIFDDRSYGVFMPKPGTHGDRRRASIFLNPFEHMITNRGVAPIEDAVERSYITAVHEALHWHIGVDGPHFEAELATLLNQLGPQFAAEATARIMEAYADPTDPGQYRRGLLDLLPLYQASRRRQATQEDAISTASSRAERPPDQPDRARPPPADVRRGGGKVVTRDELKRIAKRRGTSVQHERERALDHGYEIADEGLLEPAVRALAEAATQERNLILGVLAPAKVGVAPLAAGSIRAHTAANDQRKARVSQWLAPIIRQMDRWSEAQSLTFADVMEGVQPITAIEPEWRPIAKVFHDTLVTWRATLLEHDLLQSYLEHYWPHEWQQESLEGKSLRKLFGRRPVQGPESYRKHRTIPTFRQGVEFGLTPATWNPAEMLQRKIFEMSQSLKGRELHNDLIKTGLYAYVPATKPKPDHIKHWQRVPEYALGTKYAPRPEGMAFGKVIAGHYYAPPEVVRLVENHLSPGLYGKSVLYDAYKAAGNLSTQFLLGWSSFHLWLTGLESMISKQSAAIEAAARGEFAQAAKLQLQVGPQGLIKDLMRGYHAVHTFYSRDADANDVTGIIGQIVQGGGGFGWSHFEHENAPAKFMRDLQGFIGAVQRHEPVTAAKKTVAMAAHGALAAFELPTALIMNHWVPYLKASAFLDMADLELRRLGPGARIEDVRRVLGEAWDTVDDRLGQLRYDNLFWDNTFKQILTGGFLSVGWNLGSLRAGIGVLGQIPRTLRTLQAARGGGGGLPPRPPASVPRGAGEGPEQSRFEATSEPWLQRNVAWIVSLVALVGLTDAIYQYLRAKKRPGEKDDGSFDLALAMKDLAYPRNGERDRNGREERDAPISYLKDYYAWTHHPIATVEHKLKPILGMTWEAISNENFYGDAIRDEDDPVLRQVWDTVKATLLRQLPVSAANALHRAGDDAPLSEQFKEWVKIQAVPFTPAAAEIERSDLENYLQGLLPPLHRTKEEAARASARRQLRKDLEAGKPDAVATARTSGLSAASIRATTRSERLGSLMTSFERTTWPQALRGFRFATDEERVRLTPVIRRKAGRALAAASTPEARARIIEQAQDVPELRLQARP